MKKSSLCCPQLHVPSHQPGSFAVQPPMLLMHESFVHDACCMDCRAHEGKKVIEGQRFCLSNLARQRRGKPAAYSSSLELRAQMCRRLSVPYLQKLCSVTKHIYCSLRPTSPQRVVLCDQEHLPHALGSHACVSAPVSPVMLHTGQARILHALNSHRCISASNPFDHGHAAHRPSTYTTCS